LRLIARLACERSGDFLAARSGRQNIAEGSRAAATSTQTELRLVNLARCSLEELRLDDEDYLRHRHLPQWAPESPEASAGLPRMRRAHGPAHRQSRQDTRQPVLGLHRLPQVPRHRARVRPRNS